MARRGDIDWEKIERLYVAQQLTIKEISLECGVSDSQIRAKAKERGWTRNLDKAIRERAKAKISQIDVSALVEQSANESAQKSAETIRQAIENAADIAAGVVIRHRAAIKSAHERVESMESVLDSAFSNIGNFENDEAEIDVRLVKTATAALKDLVDVRKNLIAMERQAFGIGDDNGDSDDSADSPIEISVELVGVSDGKEAD